MLSAYLDGELTQADRQRVRLYLESSEEGRLELQQLTALQQMTAELRFGDPPDRRLDAIEAKLSVQGPRRFGWGLTIAGLLSWVVYVVFLYVKNIRWPSIPEFLAGGVIAGLLAVFLSVVRQRYLERPHDRYTKVKR
jgi:anti-sigma factor RsiW